MSRHHIGELEELVLLLVAIESGKAYGVSVMKALVEETARNINISAIHAALRRLESKGMVQSSWSESTDERGGRRKRVFTITNSGVATLKAVRAVRNNLWDQIPNIAFKYG